VKTAGVTDLQKLKGKTIGVSDLASPGKNFFAILLTKHGIDPNKDVEWRQYPADLLGLAVEKGEIQAIADGDPNLYLIQKRNKDLVELATNLSGEYADKTCCVLGVRGSLVRGDKATAAALTRAIVEASDWVANNPNESARIFAKFSPVPEADLRAVLGTLTHNHHPSGIALRQQVEFYARDFKTIGVFKPGTDPAKFAAHVVADVLA
jgi:NitT/TauT family transport system substrate-binding protein